MTLVHRVCLFWIFFFFFNSSFKLLLNQWMKEKSMHMHHHIRSKQDAFVKNPWKAQICLYILVSLRHIPIKNYIDFGPINGQAECFYRSCIILSAQKTYRRMPKQPDFSIRWYSSLRISQVSYLPVCKNLPKTHFSYFSQSWNVDESVKWAFPFCSAPRSQLRYITVDASRKSACHFSISHEQEFSF